MKKKLPALILFLFCAIVKGQDVSWAVNTPTPSFVSHLVVDRASNVYMYGSSEIEYRPDLEGSVLRKYSSNGELIYSREWKTKFFISSMINDGKGHFYFCGRFQGDLHQQGISLRSHGSHDAFLGRMDEEGNIEWTLGFGGSQSDRLTDISFNSDSSEIAVTGGIDSTIMLNGYELNTPPRSIFVASFGLDGQILHYRIYSNYTNEYGSNMGLEIASDGGAGFYLLADKMGDHWSNEAHPSGSPMEGRHVMLLDSSLNVKWSRFIISSSCYYGYSCSGMGVQNGMACVPSFCSGKYGGSGRLEKLGGTGGVTSFSLMNNDGQYYDTYGNGKSLFYVGNEEVNGCPCQDNNPGFARVKVLDENNQDRILLSKYAFHFYNIVVAPNGNIYVAGETDGRDDQLQGHALHQGYFLFAMRMPPTSFEAVDPAEQAITAYPNPSADYVEIVDEDLMTELVVYNSAGVIIRNFKPNAKSLTIKNLDAGYYLVRVKNEKGYRTGKVLVVK